MQKHGYSAPKDDEIKSTAKLLGWILGIVCIAGIVAGVVAKSDAPGWKIADDDRITNVEIREVTKPAPKPVWVISVTCTKPNLFVDR